MNRFKKITLFVTALAVCVGASAQKDLLISGGNVVSCLVCSNQKVYVTGLNETQEGKNILGLGLRTDKNFESIKNVTKWEEVIFPLDAKGQGVNIQQVNSGSGSAFVALDCYGQVWGWGNNSHGQTGIGTDNPRAVPSPIQVKLASNSPLRNTVYDDGYGHLTGVDVVYAGNANSFAILGDGPYKGRVVAWGGNIANNNYTSCLGTGSDAQEFYPTFCKTINGSYIDNVIRIFSGDHLTIALRSDGTVWTCGDGSGDGGQLGRAANGGLNTTNTVSASNAFGAVYVAAGQMLSNIKEIACGDGAYFALDANGYIWSWGNHGWNGCGGTGISNQVHVPARVLAGEAANDPKDSDGTYLLAKAVGAGQAVGMAITLSGKPVAWGGGGCSGGYLGDGSDGGTSPTPVYIKSGSTVHDDVIIINRGDSWGFYARNNGQMYAWGCNSEGQLGIGSQNNQKSAISINPPQGCGFRDPTPAATLTPGDMKVCASAFRGATLDCGFGVDASLADNYEITWYKDGQKITSASGNGTKTVYTTPNGAAGIGKYNVEIKYVGHNNGCMEYPIAKDSVEISAYTQEFTPTGYYCGETATVKINNPSSTGAEYTWWETQAANRAYGKTTGSEELQIDVSQLIANADGTKTVYVQETAMGSGYLIPGTQSQRTAANNAIGQAFPSLGIEFSADTKIGDASVYLLPAITRSNSQGSFYDTKAEAEAQHKTLTGSIILTINVYGAELKNGKLVAKTTDRKKTITHTIPYTYEYYPDEVGSQNQWNSSTQTSELKYQPKWNGGDINLPIELVKIPFDLELPVGTYFFAISGSTSGVMNSNNTKLYELNSGLVGQVDNLNGKAAIYGADNYANYASDKSGPLFNFHLYSQMGFCDVVKVDLIQDCPCDPPADFHITCDDASYFSPTYDTIVVCANNAHCTLGTTKWANSGTKFDYIWYKDGVAGAATVANQSADYAVSAAGEYKILVRDKGVPDATACQISKTVKVMLNPIPTVTMSGGGEICYGETLTTPVTFTMTGVPKFRVYWNESKDGGTPSSKNRRSSGYTLEVQTPTAVGEYTYTVTAVNDDGNCKDETVTGTKTITIKPLPTVTLSSAPDPAEVCEGSAVILTAGTESSATLKWMGKGSGSDATQNLTAVNQSGTYKVTSSMANCWAKDTLSVDVTIHEKPVIKTLVASPVAVCSGETITLTATTSDGETGTFTWPSGVTGSGKTATISKEVETTTTETITLNYRSADGCEAISKDVEVTFYAMPKAPSPDDVAYCSNASQSTVPALTATAAADGTLYWYGKNATGGTGSTTAPKPQLSEGTTTYYVSQKVNGCESPRAELKVTINDGLVPSIKIDDNELCPGDKTKISLTQDFPTVTWTAVTAGTYDDLSLKTPTFTAGSVASTTT
ncbi:MAG: hypothetical protein J5588_01915, partial [Bacteroidales bacterium]|nr:hypothetical protein [Bacteroidales bacterium]